MRAKDNEIKHLDEKVQYMEDKNFKLEAELSKALDTLKVSELVVKEATESVVAIFSKMQDEMEKRNEARLDSLHNQLAMISSLHVPPACKESDWSPSSISQPSNSNLEGTFQKQLFKSSWVSYSV